MSDFKFSSVHEEKFRIEIQKYYSAHNEKSKKLQWSRKRIQNVINLLEDFATAKVEGRRGTSQQYNLVNKYEVFDSLDTKILILKRKSILDPVIQIVPSEEYFQVILDTHLDTAHGRRDKIIKRLKDKFMVPRFAITLFLNLCETCIAKKSFRNHGIGAKRVISQDFAVSSNSDETEINEDDEISEPPQKKLKESEDELFEQFLKVIHKAEDDAGILGAFVASSMRNLKKEDSKKKLRRQILRIILDVEEQDELPGEISQWLPSKYENESEIS